MKKNLAPASSRNGHTPVASLRSSRALHAPQPLLKPIVLWAAAEAVPWASAGGLGDVAGSLPAVLRARGWDVRLVLPYYTQLTKRPVSAPIFELDLPTPGREHVALREAIDPPQGVPTYLVECDPLFGRSGLYGDNGSGYWDAPYRYGIFQLAVRVLAERLQPTPAILHCHDWHTGLLPALIAAARAQGRAGRLNDLRTVFTIHNLQYQGDADVSLLDNLCLPRALFHPEWAEHFGALMPMKAALQTADRVTTVSPTYAREIRTPGRGMGLDGVLRARGTDVRGILNGIDTTSWNPALDPALPARFSADEPGDRALGTKALRHELGLSGDARAPLIGFVGRLINEKGVDLVTEAAPRMLAAGAQIVALGTGDPRLEAALLERQAAAPDQFRAVLRFDAAFARRLYAGVDILLVPSRTEPCGLVQLYALRYGAVPIVHAVGGLADTVKDGVTGFTFREPTARALADAVDRALAVWKTPAAWAELRARGMREDWSWAKSAADYERLYEEIIVSPPRALALPADTAVKIAPEADWGPPLAPLLGRDTLHVMVQDPGTLYAYWETRQTQPLELLLEERPSGRIYQVSVDRPASSDYWLSARPEAAYRAVLRAPNGDVVAVSNAVITPRDRPAPPGEGLPAWLARALEHGLLDDDAVGEIWADVFTGAPRFVRGKRVTAALALAVHTETSATSLAFTHPRPSASPPQPPAPTPPAASAGLPLRPAAWALP